MRFSMDHQTTLYILNDRMNFFHDIIKTSSIYLKKSTNIMNGVPEKEDEFDRLFCKITSYFNYDISKLKFRPDPQESIKSYLNSLINLHMHIKKRPNYETKKRIEECKTSRKQILSLINSENLIFCI